MYKLSHYQTVSPERLPGLTYLLKGALLLLLTVLVTASPLSAGTGMTSGRSAAMGGAYLSLADGAEAARFNPANLGLAGYQVNSLEIFGLGASIANNSFSLNDYNTYTGAFLANADKEYILNKIPEDGLTVSADIQASALSVSYGAMAFSMAGVGLADINLNKDLIDLVLNGNTFADTIEISGSYSEAVSYVSAGFSYGYPVYSNRGRQLAVGATVKYLRGIAVEEIVELEGLAATFETGFTGQGRMIARTAAGGSGYAIDIGAALRINESYTAGVTFKNFISHLSWNNDCEEHGYLFSFDTMTVDNMEDDFVVTDDYSRETGAFSSNLPSVMTVGVAHVKGPWIWAADWEQGFRRAAGASGKPRLSAGVEYSPLPWCPVRAGLAAGGNKNTRFSFGSGVDVSAYYFDFAFITGSSLSPSSSKGLNFAVSTGVRF